MCERMELEGSEGSLKVLEKKARSERREIQCNRCSCPRVISPTSLLAPGG